MTDTEDWIRQSNSSIGYWRKIIDGVHVVICGHPDKESYMFSFRMNATISIKSKFLGSWSECQEALEYIQKDMVWRRAKSFAKNNPPPAWIPDFQI